MKYQLVNIHDSNKEITLTKAGVCFIVVCLSQQNKQNNAFPKVGIGEETRGKKKAFQRRHPSSPFYRPCPYIYSNNLCSGTSFASANTACGGIRRWVEKFIEEAVVGVWWQYLWHTFPPLSTSAFSLLPPPPLPSVPPNPLTRAYAHLLLGLAEKRPVGV